MSSAGADGEAAARLPPGDGREAPAGAAQSWPDAQRRQGRGESTVRVRQQGGQTLNGLVLALVPPAG